MYNSFVKSVYNSSTHLSKKYVSKNKFKVIPGWNRRVKDIYIESRWHYKSWLNVGKPRYGPVFDQMKNSKSVFKASLRQCKNDRSKEILQSIEEKLKFKNYKEFWCEVKSKKASKHSSPIIDGESGDKEILEIFNSKFFHQNNTQSNFKNDMLNNFNARRLIDKNSFIMISDYTLSKLINKLNDGMGHDMIHSKLLKNANVNFIANVVVLLNCCFNHNFIPNEMLKGEIVPIIKDKNGNLSNSDNYRPIMQSSCILKLLELHILDFLEEKLFFNSTQFGFEKGVSTSHACLLLKEILSKYKLHNLKVYTLFADLSKAFDRVDHFKLGDILI